MPNRTSSPLSPDFIDAETCERLVAGVGRLVRIRSPRLLGLGEPSHGPEDFAQLRNHVFEYLVDHHGYRSIALETDSVAAVAVDAHVRDGTGDIDEVMTNGFSHQFGRLTANRELVQWMRRRNANLAPSDRLRFHGFDGPLETMWASSPRDSLLAVHGYLSMHLPAKDVPAGADEIEKLTGDDADWTNPAAAMHPERSIGHQPRVNRLRLLADDLHAVLVRERPGLIRASSADDHARVAMHARAASGLLRYHGIMADDRPDRIIRLLAERAGIMAGNLEAIADGPTLVFANNAHLQRHRSQWGPGGYWWSAGSIVAAADPDEYAVVAGDFGAAPNRSIPAPAAETLQGRLAAHSSNPELLTAAQLAELLADQPEPLPRDDFRPETGYSPLNGDVVGGVDGVVFLPSLTGTDTALW